jgi:hypothetical protein
LRSSRVPDAPKRSRGAPGWFASVALCAALLDACLAPGAGPLGAARWLDLAAVAGLVTAFGIRRGARHASAWRTPLDGRITAALAVLLLAAAPWRGITPDAVELRLVLSGVACFYAVSALVAGDASSLESAWLAFPLAASALGLHALWAATTGLERLAAAAAEADGRWGARHSLDSALLVATALTLGRAAERGATPGWRLAAVVGSIGVLLHAAASGAPFDTRSLVRLEAPLDFSATVVVALVLHWLGRTAWTLRGERPAEAGRWWGAVAGVTALGATLLYGTGPAPEGLVVLAGIVAAVIATARALPAAAIPAPLPAAEPAAPLSRAA